MSEIANHPPVSTVGRVNHSEFRKQDLMDELPDNILPRVATGDSAAVSQCLDRYGGLVWSLARRSSPDTQSAEDAVQDIFIKLWKVADRFDPSIASEATFVAMIARRTLIDLRRKRKLDVFGDIELDGLQGDFRDIAEITEVRDEAARASRLLTQLPAAQQQVIKLNIFDGLSHARIAETTGLSLGTVKTHIRRGILKLRRALFPEATPYPDEPLGPSPSSPGEALS